MFCVFVLKAIVPANDACRKTSTLRVLAGRSKVFRLRFIMPK